MRADSISVPTAALAKVEAMTIFARSTDQWRQVGVAGARDEFGKLRGKRHPDSNQPKKRIFVR